MTSRLLGRALRGALTRCRPSTPQLLSARLAVPRASRFSQAVDTPPASEAATSSVAAAAAAEPAEEAAAEPPVAAAAPDAAAAEEPAAAVQLSEKAMGKRIDRCPIARRGSLLGRARQPGALALPTTCLPSHLPLPSTER